MARDSSKSGQEFSAAAHILDFPFENSHSASGQRQSFGTPAPLLAPGTGKFIKRFQLP